jgi:hypothetical protein
MFFIRLPIRLRIPLHRCFVLLIASSSLAGNAATASDLIATKPGVMCVSTQALAELTLPSGESRSHGDAATPAQLAQAQAGGCLDIQPGMTVSVQTAHKNTSVVSFQRPGAAASETFVIPNIDFVPVFAEGEEDDTAQAEKPARASAGTP